MLLKGHKEETQQSRYIIGIDLGTTNSCMCYVDTDQDANPGLSVQLFSIPQITGEGLVEDKAVLPSSCYVPAEYEVHKRHRQLPWDGPQSLFVGEYAKEYGARVPTHLIHSAKSWLCNAAAARKDRILPLTCDTEELRLSPVEATAAYLDHMRQAWNFSMAKGDPEREFEQQEVIVTVPASFDEVARQLTVEAAQQAGYRQLTLVEEPQAAFYRWIARHENTWHERIAVGERVLICDVGGGTSDLSLIEVRQEGDKSSLQRMAVGRHLLLGGDNMDLALCHYCEKKLEIELDTEQWHQLLHQVRSAKERLLGEQETATLLLQGKGSKVIEGSIRLEIEAREVQKFLLDGFFVQEDYDTAAQIRKTSALRAVGLPYESEAAITKHIAHFLREEAHEETLRPVHHVLFNGGSMEPPLFRNAILDSLERWQGFRPQELESDSLHLAVARGAAYYGKARRGLATRIRSGLPRSYYIQVGEKALTLLTRGMEEGATYEPEQVFSLKPNQPVAFHLFSSHTRIHDQLGDWVALNEEEFMSLPSIHTVFRYGKKKEEQSIPVTLKISFTEVGTLDLMLQAQETEHRWKLEFQLRSASGQENSLLNAEKSREDETFEENFLEPAAQILRETFQSSSPKKSSSLMDALEKALDMSREKWSVSVLRGLWLHLVECKEQRNISPAHCGRWWNLAGFFLRPGFGYPLDDHRVKEMWKCILEKNPFENDVNCRMQRWICYRRIAGGLTKGQQKQLANQILPTILKKKGNELFFKKGEHYEYSEKLRALAAMEFLDRKSKETLGNALLKRVEKNQALPCDYWALGRLGARQLLYGSVGDVLSPSIAGQWAEALTKGGTQSKEVLALLEQLIRRTSQRELNLPTELVEKVLCEWKGKEAFEHLQEVAQKEVLLTQKEQEYHFGDRLPLGLSVANP